MFKEKLHDLAFGEGDMVILRCVIVGPPAPTVVWYKNEELLSDGGRLKVGGEWSCFCFALLVVLSLGFVMS
jgi:hypothetical protein